MTQTSETAGVTTVAKALGGNVRAIRQAHELTLSDVAKAVRAYGLQWSTGRVGDIENGRGAVTIETAVALSLALSEATGQPVTVPDLVRPAQDEALTLGKGVDVYAGAFVDVVRGEKTELRASEVVGDVEAVNRALSSTVELFSDVGEGVKVGQVRAALKARDLADQRAARKLGVSEGAFIGACLRRWGQLLSQEAAYRAGAGASPQARGQITRKLLEELKADFPES